MNAHDFCERFASGGKDAQEPVFVHGAWFCRRNRCRRRPRAPVGAAIRRGDRDYLLGGVRDVVDDAVATGLHATKRARKAVDDVTDQVKEAANVGQRVYSKTKEA